MNIQREYMLCCQTIKVNTPIINKGPILCIPAAGSCVLRATAQELVFSSMIRQGSEGKWGLFIYLMNKIILHHHLPLTVGPVLALCSK